MRTLTTSSTTSTEILGDTSTEMRRRAVVLQVHLVWPEGNVRPLKKVVAGPVPNAASSLMLPVTGNEYNNSLVADEFAVSCSRKVMLEYDEKFGGGWGGCTDSMAGGFPSRVKVASSQTCAFHKSILFQRPTTNLYLASVMSGWTAWMGGDFPDTKFATPTFDGCV